MIKVGIIDSGINSNALSRYVKHRNCIDESNCFDVNGHGTMCAYIIEKYSCSDLIFYSYKIFEEKLKAKREHIIKALEYAINDKLDVLNMSLSIHVGIDNEITDLINELKRNGTRVIAAKCKGGINTLLDSINDIIIVDGCDGFAEEYKITSPGRVMCSREPILCKYYKSRYAFFGGNSKATALYAALSLKNNVS
ncbi:MAG: S8 family serine peptidase, partial [Lachnospiraceae bacterium]|nr:S8 family serine peptidase [Lachnospiraceae bacterium]